MDKRIELIRELVGSGRLEEAIEKLLELVESEYGLDIYRNAVILLRARYKNFRSNELQGVLHFDEIQLRRSKLNNTILKLTVDISVTIKDKKGSTVTTPLSGLGCSLILLPVLILCLITGIGGFIYYKIIDKPESENITIFGKVYDSDDNNKPLKNARVEIVDLLGVFSATDDSGAFTFEIDNPEKKYLEFQVTCNEYKTQSFNIAIKPNKDNEQSLEKFLIKRIVTEEKQDKVVPQKRQNFKELDNKKVNDANASSHSEIIQYQGSKTVNPIIQGKEFLKIISEQKEEINEQDLNQWINSNLGKLNDEGKKKYQELRTNHKNNPPQKSKIDKVIELLETNKKQ